MADLGHNSGDLDKLIKTTMDEVAALDEQRKSLGSQISEKKAALEVVGISRGAFNRAYRDWIKDARDTDREGHLGEQDADYLVCREAAGIPLTTTVARLLPKLDSPEPADQPDAAA